MTTVINREDVGADEWITAGWVRYYFVNSGSADNSIDLRKLLACSTIHARDLWRGRVAYLPSELATLAEALDRHVEDFSDHDAFEFDYRHGRGIGWDAEISRLTSGTRASLEWANAERDAAEQRVALDDLKYLSRSLLSLDSGSEVFRVRRELAHLANSLRKSVV